MYICKEFQFGTSFEFLELKRTNDFLQVYFIFILQKKVNFNFWFLLSSRPSTIKIPIQQQNQSIPIHRNQPPKQRINIRIRTIIKKVLQVKTTFLHHSVLVFIQRDIEDLAVV